MITKFKTATFLEEKSKEPNSSSAKVKSESVNACCLALPTLNKFKEMNIIISVVKFIILIATFKLSVSNVHKYVNALQIGYQKKL